MRWSCLLAVIGPVLLSGCGRSQGEAVTVFAAASAHGPLERLAAAFQDQTGTAVLVHAGPSSTLAHQIEHGANADLFLSADLAWSDYLKERGLVAAGRALLTNRLVVVGPTEGSVPLRELADLASPSVSRLALAGAAVPAGRYARQALSRAGVWEQVQGRVLEGGDVRSALAYVVRGEAEVGLVYATDVRGEARVRQLLEVAAELHNPIHYPLVLIQPAKPSARAFFDYLLSPAAEAEFRRAGFGIVP